MSLEVNKNDSVLGIRICGSGPKKDEFDTHTRIADSRMRMHNIMICDLSVSFVSHSRT